MTKMTKALRHNINLLEQQVAALRAERSTKRDGVVSTYTKRDGSRWDKVRTGWNTYAHRPAN